MSITAYQVEAVGYDRTGKDFGYVNIMYRTEVSKHSFPKPLQKLLVFTDHNGKTSLETMLKRWYTQLEKEYRSQTAG